MRVKRISTFHPKPKPSMGFSIGGWDPFGGNLVDILTGGTINGVSVFSGGLPGLAAHLEEVAQGVNVDLLGGTIGGALNSLMNVLDQPINDTAGWINDHKAFCEEVALIVGTSILGPMAYAAWAASVGSASVDAAISGVASYDAAMAAVDASATAADVAAEAAAADAAAQAASDAIAQAATDAQTAADAQAAAAAQAADDANAAVQAASDAQDAADASAAAGAPDNIQIAAQSAADSQAQTAAAAIDQANAAAQAANDAQDAADAAASASTPEDAQAAAQTAQSIAGITPGPASAASVGSSASDIVASDAASQAAAAQEAANSAEMDLVNQGLSAQAGMPIADYAGANTSIIGTSATAGVASSAGIIGAVENAAAGSLVAGLVGAGLKAVGIGTTKTAAPVIQAAPAATTGISSKTWLWIAAAAAVGLVLMEKKK